MANSTMESTFQNLINVIKEKTAPISHNHTVSDISDFPTLGTASTKDVPVSGDAGNSEVVLGNDTRLSDSRTPTSHTHTVSDISDLAQVAISGSYNDLTDTPSLPTFGTAASRDVPVSGDAAIGEVVIGSDSRLADARTPLAHTHTVSDISDFPESMPASDVYSWAKAETKPTYTASEVGALSESDGQTIALQVAQLSASKIGISQVGIAGGVAGLDENSEITGAETISALEVKEIWDSIPEPVRPSVIYESSSELSSYTYEFDEDGLYLVMCGYPHSGSASIAFSNAEIISEDAAEVTSSGNVRGVLSKIARVEAGETVTINLTWSSSWPGRVLSIVKLVGFDIDTEFATVKNITADGYTSYTLPADTNKYLVYGMGLSKSANNSKNETAGGSYKHIDGNWGYNSICMVALCKGVNSPLFKFHGYDGGLSAIFAWKIEA